MSLKILAVRPHRAPFVCATLCLLLSWTAPPSQAVEFLWDIDGDGVWQLDGNWDQAGFPDGADDNATIFNATTATDGVVVTLGSSEDVGDITINDSGNASDQNTLSLSNNVFLDVHGDIFNNGIIALNSAGAATRIRADGGSDLTLNGSGVINLGAGTENGFGGVGGGLTLINTVMHTIAGGGNIGENSMGINNVGTINANLTGVTMTIDPSSALGTVNTGTMQATNGGIMLFTGSVSEQVTNTGGVIEAVGAGSEIQLTQNQSIVGGTVRGTGGGLVRGNASQNYFFTDVTFEGAIQADNNSDFGISGMITNNGTITMASLGANTDLELQANSTLTGPGSVVLSGSTAAGINGTAGNHILTNAASHTIEGRGSFGENSIGIINQGTIEANVSGETLTIDPDNEAGSGSGLMNTGTMRATGGGILSLTGNGLGSFTNTGGVIEAVGAGSEVQLSTNANIVGGTVRGTGGGLVRGNASQNYFFTDVTFEGAIQADNNSDFGISGTITNNGTITMASAGANTDLELQANSTLTGPGSVVLSGSTAAGINGTAGNHILTNAASHTIEGLGSFGENTIGIVNQGTIDANVSGQTLTIDPDAVNNLTNTATMRATGGGILSLTGNGGGTFNNATGVIEAIGAGSEVQLSTNASIVGGTVRGTGGGLVRGSGSASFFFTDVTFEGAIQGDNNSNFGISGTITNNGAITMVSGGANTDIELQTNSTLTGTGSVVLSGSTAAGINGTAGNHILTNAATHTIEGRGSFGENTIGIVNQGTIDANVSGQTLTIDPDDESGAGNGLMNTGTMRATGGGILSLTGSGLGTFTNTNGMIEAVSAGSEVQLTNNASIVGGTVRGTGGGLVRGNANQSYFFTDVTFEGAIQGDNNSDFGISGTITNNGTITIVSGGANTDIELQTNSTLTGTGSVVLSGSTAAGINGTAGNHILTNAATHTIEGRGSFGENSIGIVNQGTIDANVSGETMTIDPDAVNNLTNTGTLRASGGGTLSLINNGLGDFTNTGGVIEALDDSTVTGNGDLTNLLGGLTPNVLDGGTYRAIDTGNGASLNLETSGNNVATIAVDTTVTLSGPLATAFFGSFDIQNTLLDNNGNLNLLDGQNFVMANALGNTGTVTLGGAGLNPASLDSNGAIANSASGLIAGHGTIEDTILNSGTVLATGGTLIMNGVIDGQSGTIEIDLGATLDLATAGGNSDADFLIHNGDGLALGGNDVLVGEDYTNANFGSGNAFNPRANVTGAGDILASPQVAQTIAGANVANGATATPTLDLGNIRVGDSKTENYQVNNVGANGPVLRGAIQTNNAAGFGGNLTDPRLSGSGATAGDFGPIANNGATGNLAVTFDGTDAGAIAAGQQVAVVNNFDNVDNQTLTITGAAFNPAVADVAPLVVPFGNFHVGDAVVAQAITISNTAPAGAFSEDLLANNFAFNGDAVNAGSPASVQVLAGGADNQVMVSINTAVAGARAGSFTADMISTGEVNGVAIPGLAPLGLPGATVNVSASVFRFAAPALQADPTNLGDFHVGDLAQGAVVVENIAPNDGFSEDLQVMVAGFNPDVTAAAGNAVVAPGANSGAAINATLDTATVGNKAGTVSLDRTSLAVAGTGLNNTNLGNVNANVTGTVYRLAGPVIDNVPPIDFGIVHVGDVVAPMPISITNSSAADGFSENLDAAFNATPAGVLGNGGMINDLAAQGTDNASLAVTLDTTNALVVNGNAVLDFTSDGTGVNTLGQTALAAQNLQIIGQINEFAKPTVLKLAGGGTLSLTGPDEYLLDFGTLIVGAPNPTAELGVLNDVLAPADELAGSFATGGAAFNFAGFGPFANLLPGITQGGLMVSFDTSTIGSFGGQILLNPLSENSSGFSGALGQVTINLTGDVAIPEPSTWVLLCAGMAAACVARYTRSSVRWA